LWLFEFRVDQDVLRGDAAIARGPDRLDALYGGRRQPVKGLDCLSGAWAARLNARQAPLSGCRRPQECIQAIKAVSRAAAAGPA
jgi:hypothetical protein